MRSLYDRIFGYVAAAIGFALGVLSATALAIGAITAPVVGTIRELFRWLRGSRAT